MDDRRSVTIPDLLVKIGMQAVQIDALQQENEQLRREVESLRGVLTERQEAEPIEAADD